MCICIAESVKEKDVRYVQLYGRQKSFTDVGEALCLDVGREGVRLMLGLVFGLDLDLAITDDGINEKSIGRRGRRMGDGLRCWRFGLFFLLSLLKLKKLRRLKRNETRIAGCNKL